MAIGRKKPDGRQKVQRVELADSVPKAEKHQHASIEDTEGLLINLAVVAALMLSFVIGVFSAGGGGTFAVLR